MTDKLEGLKIMLHFWITIAIFGGYLYTAVIGHPDATLQGGVLLSLGYWFGMRGAKQKKDEVETK